MAKVVKLLSYTFAIAILVVFFFAFFQGMEGMSALLGCDIDDISMKGPARMYEFSLVERLPIIVVVGIILIGFFVFVGMKADAVVGWCKSGFAFFKQYCVDTFYLIKGSKVKYFLLLSFLTTTFLAYFFPLTLDEPQTYYDFVKPPFWHALVFYPYPNNHVFSSLLSNITNEIPMIDLLFRIRIPVILVSLLTWVVAYRFVRKYFSENLAISIVAIGTVVVTNMQHAYIARGYAFVMFFVVIGLYAGYNIIYNGNRRRDWLAFALSSALGAWSMPSYLYPFLSISIFIFIYNYKYWKTQLFYSVLVGVLVFLFYSPILVFSGLEALTSNEFVETIDRMTVVKSIPGFMLGTTVHIFYVPYFILIAIFAFSIGYAVFRRDKNTLILWLVFGLTPALFLILHSVLPFFRTFFYYGFLFVFIVGVTYREEIARLNAKLVFAVALVLHLLLGGYFFSISRDLMYDVFLSHDLQEEILEDGKSYYLQDGISWIEMINLDFEAERKGYDIKTNGGGLNNVDQVLEYDYFLIEKSGDRTTDYTPFLETKSVFSKKINVYKIEK